MGISNGKIDDAFGEEGIRERTAEERAKMVRMDRISTVSRRWSEVICEGSMEVGRGSRSRSRNRSRSGICRNRNIINKNRRRRRSKKRL